MGNTGILANIAICDGGHAEGTLGQASKLKALVRQLTPKKTLAAVSQGSVFGGGRLFLGDGSHQESLKVIAKTELHVLALPAEQALMLDTGTLVQELRNHLAFRLTYWFSRTNMIDGKVSVSLITPSPFAEELNRHAPHKRKVTLWGLSAASNCVATCRIHSNSRNIICVAIAHMQEGEFADGSRPQALRDVRASGEPRKARRGAEAL
jgi:hypothetical protein